MVRLLSVLRNARFLKSLPVTQLHVSHIQERPGTAALRIPYVVSDKEKKLRSKRLLELSEEKTQAFYAQYIGTEAEVLFEKAPRGKAMHGFTKNYVRVELSPALAKESMTTSLSRFVWEILIMIRQPLRLRSFSDELLQRLWLLDTYSVSLQSAKDIYRRWVFLS